MKLYTEEQVLQIVANLKTQSFVTSQELLDEMGFKPIELPSDEEIAEKALQVGFTNTLYIDGAKWVIDNLKNQQQ